MRKELEGQQKLGGISYGKTSQTPCQSTTGRTSAPSSKKSQKLQTKAPLFLDMRGGDGDLLELFWETDGRSLGEFMMQGGSVSHSEESGYAWSQTSADGRPRRLFLIAHGEKNLTPVETRLSDLLETTSDQKYVLSTKACMGILRRAVRSYAFRNHFDGRVVKENSLCLDTAGGGE